MEFSLFHSTMSEVKLQPFPRVTESSLFHSTTSKVKLQPFQRVEESSLFHSTVSKLKLQPSQRVTESSLFHRTASEIKLQPFRRVKESSLFQNFEVESEKESSKKKPGRKVNTGGRRRSAKNSISDSEGEGDVKDDEVEEKVAKKRRGKPKTPATKRAPRTPASGARKGAVFFFFMLKPTLAPVFEQVFILLHLLCFDGMCFALT